MTVIICVFQKEYPGDDEMINQSHNMQCASSSPLPCVSCDILSSPTIAHAILP